ncbi:enoyl-CoA hydratase/isomerase [Clostridium estertheticum]|uniref:enoyl-CoA hydratase/isomerase n=1 Tax=Clostridium estertheticum TaxID=238834 RepID=UPI001CF22DA3|nr:enoyl-CoA hydratase/isomerase [Clostridium estertheticum]MCB2360145.1 enoyl-CoA hydratase/isomerase [Clostridium estertheticum]
MDYQTINIRVEEQLCFIKFNRPEAKNTINNLMIEELHHVLKLCEEKITVIILEGSPDIFCFGADFNEVKEKVINKQKIENNPDRIYDLWTKFCRGPYITISHVRGKVNAGGIGFVAASDIVLADETAEFSLSELLFGVYPACVLPFLIKKIGFQKSNYLTLTTQSISVHEAYSWGLVDVYAENSVALLRKKLIRLTKLTKSSITEYKAYMDTFCKSIYRARDLAISSNEDMFANQDNLEKIYRYVEKGEFPWERLNS